MGRDGSFDESSIGQAARRSGEGVAAAVSGQDSEKGHFHTKYTALCLRHQETVSPWLCECGQAATQPVSAWKRTEVGAGVDVARVCSCALENDDN